MELKVSGRRLVFDKILNSLDRFALDFVRILERKGVRYVVVSGYVAILFGRSRSSEDIDIFIETVGKKRFLSLWAALSEKFECINTAEPSEAYGSYLKEGIPIRFSRKGRYVPNMEVKFPSGRLARLALSGRRQVVLNGRKLWISPLELQIEYKKALGTDKDLEDAEHLRIVLGDLLDKGKLKRFGAMIKRGRGA